jgi:hypothetical protein
VDNCFPEFGDTTTICISDLLLDFDVTPISCLGIPAAITALPLGGTGSYTYNWSTGSTMNTISGLAPGSYHITITSASATIEDSIDIHPLGYPMVTTAQDSIYGSLRQVIADACEGDTISFSSELSGRKLLLVGGEITIDKTITILGNASNPVLISALAKDRIFNIVPMGNLRLHDLILSNGYKAGLGGAILNEGNLHIDNVDIQYSYDSDNLTPITNKGTVTISGNNTMRY